MNLNKSICVLLVTLTFCLGCSDKGVSQSKEEELSTPNIVLFFVDDLGWSDLGFRNPVFETPNIDRLAQSGLSFEQAYIASPTCSPSRATLLTGKHPARLQMVRHIPGGKKFGFDREGTTDIEFHTLERDPAQFPSRNWLPLEHTTYAEVLKKSGYYNLFVGKWHLGHEKYHPIHQGFDEQIGTSNAGHPKSYYPPYFGYKGNYTDESGTYLTDKLTNEAVDFIENYKKENPFMLTFSYYSVHSPHQGREDLVEYFKNKGLKDKYAHYAAMVKATDESIGRVQEALKKKGIEKETLILFISDQGGYFENSPYRGGKMKETLFEGGSRVPFFVYWPNVTKPNTKNYSVVQSTDIFSTLAELTGNKLSDYKDIDGISLLSTLQTNDSLQRAPVFGYRAYEDLYVSVRQGDWKLLAYRSGDQKLFNIKEDHKEQNNLIKQQPGMANKLLEALKKWEIEMGVEKYSGVQ